MNGVGPSEIANNSVSFGEVVDNSLTGQDIDEATLAGVDADTVSGVEVVPFSYKSAVSSTVSTTFNRGGLELRSSCIGGDLEVTAHTTVDNTVVFVHAHNTSNEVKDFDIADSFDIVNDDDNTGGTLVYARNAGFNVVLHFLASENPFLGGATACIFSGVGFVP